MATEHTASRQKLTSSRLILGSSSPRRLELLKQAGFPPDIVVAADIDETPYRNELPHLYALRVAQEKNTALASQFPDDFLITADCTGAVGRRILSKADTEDQAADMMRLMSGRNHRIYSAVVVRAPDGRIAHRIAETRVKVKHLSEADIAGVIANGDWQGRACAYDYKGYFSRFVQQIVGTSSCILGLPMYETTNLLVGLGYKQGS